MRLLDPATPEQRAEIERPYYELGHAAVMLSQSRAGQKMAGDPVYHWLSGRLYLSNSGWLLLAVPAALMRGAFQAMDEPGLELPPGEVAHVHICRPEEIADISGGADAITERGKSFAYRLGRLKSVEPLGWTEMSRAYMFDVISPELSALRRTYGLSSLPMKNGKELPFHLTVAVRRKGVLASSDVSKAAAEEPGEARKPLIVRRSVRTNGGRFVFNRSMTKVADLSSAWNSLKSTFADPNFQANALTAGGMGGASAILSGLSGAASAPPGYRWEAAKRDAFTGGLGALGTLSGMYATNKLLNESDASQKTRQMSPLAAASGVIFSHAIGDAISEAKYPLQTALFGQPSWQVRPDNLLDALQKERELRRKEKEQGLKAAASAIPLPDVKQQTNYTCGPAALSAVTSYFGDTPPNEKAVKQEVEPTPEHGTPPSRLIEAAKAAGYHVEAKTGMSVEELHSYLDRKIPVLVAMQAYDEDPNVRDNDSGHYVVAIGYDAKNIIFQDPSTTEGKRGTLPTEEFMRRWHDTDGNETPYPRLGIAIWKDEQPEKTEHVGETEKIASAKDDLIKAIEDARAATDTNPSEDQKNAGNYAKGRVTIHGLPISLENPKGSTRSGVGKDGKPWQSLMAHDYGYIRKTQSEADGDHLDVFIGPDPSSHMVFVVDQLDPGTGKFDEHKIVLGCKTKAEAEQAYRDCYDKNWKGLGGIRSLHLYAFKEWVRRGDTSKPIAEHEFVKAAESFYGNALGTQFATNPIGAAMHPIDALGQAKQLGDQNITGAQNQERFQNAMQPGRANQQVIDYLDNKRQPVVQNPWDRLINSGGAADMVDDVMFAITKKQAASPAIEALRQAKHESDRRNYREKHKILRALFKESPEDFKVDSQHGGIVGITHTSGFKIHALRKHVPDTIAVAAS